MAGQVEGVHRNARHTMAKAPQLSIRLLAGCGVEGDAHAGETVQHRYARRKDPSAPNRRQVHLMAGELIDDLAGLGFAVAPGVMGENVTTRGIDLLALPAGTRLRLGPAATIELTGLRNPCTLLDKIQPGLMKALLGRDAAGTLVRKAGVMAVVTEGGDVAPGDAITVELPTRFVPLAPV